MRQRNLMTSGARALRKEMSGPEVMLWSRLRGRGPDKPTFRRQHPIGSIIVDFYCPSARLVVEVDGNTHATDEAMRKDRARDHWLASQGIEVMRVPAAAVFRDLRTVAGRILARAEELRAQPTSQTFFSPSTTRSSASGSPPATLRVGEVG